MFKRSNLPPTLVPVAEFRKMMKETMLPPKEAPIKTVSIKAKM